MAFGSGLKLLALHARRLRNLDRARALELGGVDYQRSSEASILENPTPISLSIVG